ncbi:gluconate:H+ symporter [Brachybacterium sp. AOP43-C2-M15]|uniref:gluconate:H+ symporter n=1 Tax=Brachybacterium sp. AOP43-C2-M15 TaxID=3457661 RepID=UPI004033E70F
MPLVLTAIGVLLLLLLVMRFRVHPFIALAVSTIVLAVMLRVPPLETVDALQDGFGGTLATAGLIFGFGALLGRLLGDGGGSQRIALTLIETFGARNTQWAVVAAALILGIALFFEVGIVLLVPIVYQMAKQTKLNLVWLGLPMATGLSVMHAFLPPTPGPTVVTLEFGAPIMMVILYGAIVALPTTVIAGPLFVRAARRYVPSAFESKQIGTLAKAADSREFTEEELPGFGISLLTALFPVILLLGAGVVTIVQSAGGLPESYVVDVISMLGQPSVVMMLSVLFAMVTMGLGRGRTMGEIYESMESAAKAIGMLILILGISGSLKEVLLVGGVGDFVADLMEGAPVSPLILAWLVAALIRLAQGSATVAALTSVGIMLPIVESTSVDAALVVLAVGAGSIIASHVNDTGFWIVKESFGLSVKETLLTWTVLETIISVCGLVFVLLLSLVV